MKTEKTRTPNGSIRLLPVLFIETSKPASEYASERRKRLTDKYISISNRYARCISKSRK